MVNVAVLFVHVVVVTGWVVIVAVWIKLNVLEVEITKQPAALRTITSKTEPFSVKEGFVIVKVAVVTPL